MIITTAISPIACMPATYSSGNSPAVAEYMLFANTWTLAPQWFYYSPGFSFLILDWQLSILIITGWSLLFTYGIIRYVEGKITHRRAHFYGFLSVLPVIIIGLIHMSQLLSSNIIAYSGSIPIQLLVGLIIIRYMKSNNEDENESITSRSHWWDSEGD